MDAGAPGRHQGAAGPEGRRNLAPAPRQAGRLPPDGLRRHLPGLACGGGRLLYRARHHGSAVRTRLLRGSSLPVPVCASAVPGADSGDTALANAVNELATAGFGISLLRLHYHSTKMRWSFTDHSSASVSNSCADRDASPCLLLLG